MKQKLKKIFNESCFENFELKKIVVPISHEKIKASKGLRKYLKIFYSYISQKFPSIFGYIYLAGKLKIRNISIWLHIAHLSSLASFITRKYILQIFLSKRSDWL